MFDLTGRTAVVTGADGNLGPVWVETLREAGAKVHELKFPKYDVRVPADLRGFALRIGGVPDIIVNNAAIDNPPGSDASFFGCHKEIVETNLNGAINVCETFVPMMSAKGGVVINVSSIMAYGGADYRNYEAGWEKPVGYNVSKAGLIQLSRSITTQYGRYGIRGVTIAFGPFDNGKFDDEFKEKFLRNVPMGRMQSKKSVQQTLLFAACCQEFAGQDLLIDGGLMSW